ncbi:non-ribosomal peptide synthetase [Flavobacterium eburneipallidum]|uniref:non-ribosomal peptide synthetase n=1 Tax=Flavobacterium eburneipallidum TaxID=3003263 RepID=UPI0024831ECF|nr:non-ribosomal peptide synthetase [Flavobacterium eburneipallidum]
MSSQNHIFDPFAGPELELVVHTTKSQSEIWTACYFGGSDAARAYNESISMDFSGSLDSIAMERAIQTLVERHEALRATFSTDGVYMSIYKQSTIKLATIDLSNLEEIDKKQALDKYTTEDAYFVFDLVHEPLLKVSLLKLAENSHTLVITAHHIICDGWSIGIILQELGSIYSAYITNKAPDLPLPIAFSAYANEEQLFSISDENKATEKFWLEVYENSIPVLNVPTDNPRPSLRTFKSKRLDVALDSDLLAKLKQTGLSVGSSLVSTLLTSFELFLYQLTGQDDIVIGLPVAGQPVAGMNNLIGHCVSLLPLRSKPIANISFKEYLKQRKSELFDAYEHSQLSFGNLLQQLNVARDPSRIPLVPIAFNIDLGMTDGVDFSNLTYKMRSNPKAYGVFEIFVNASGNEKNLVFEWSYNEALFNPETIKNMMVSFEELVQKTVEDSSKTLGQIVSQDFTSQNNTISVTTMDYPKSTLHELFAVQAKTQPNAIALEFQNKPITYGELEKMINQTANYLWSQGLRPGQIVAVSLDRSPELIASMFAVLQCGASYIPIDPMYPDARLNLMIEDADATFYIGLNSKKGLPDKVNAISIATILSAIEDLPTAAIDFKVDTTSAAYIIYTSGSTGKPKGVQVAHCNAINLVYSMAAAPGISAKDKIFSVTTISFDAMVMETYLPLLFGACVVFVNEETRRDGRLLLKKAVEDKITMMWGTPSIWQILLDSGWEKPLPIKALIGGEPVPKPLAHELLAKCDELWNIYGPTETTVCSLLTQISINDDPITIGKPIANTIVYLLDANRNPVRQGEIGEIVIAGDGVSLGYLNRPDLTEERFIPNHFEKESNGKMYLSGDLGKLLPNGQVQCLGRKDHQVKVRGYRIELGEIEHSLMSIDNIKTAAVLAKNDILIAFIVAENEITNQQNQIQLWRNELESQLPTFMVPHVFHILEKMPTTSNDKIDRKALSEYKSNWESIPEYTAPRTEEEKLVATIWKESLNLEHIDIYSNFFEIGGHSIKAVKVMIEIEKKIGKQIPISSLFEYSTIEKFAQLLNPDNKIESDCLVPIKQNGSKVPLFIVHGAGLDVLNFVNLSKHFDEDQPIYAIQGSAKKYDEWYDSIEDMAAHYIDAIVKIHPNGPYALAGFSFGGIIAFEMTRQLKEQGKNVSLTALLDTYVDSSYYYKTLQQKKLIRYLDNTHRRLDFLKEMLTSWKGFKMRFNAKKEHILKKYFGTKYIMTEQEAFAFDKFSKANSMVDSIVDRYHLKPQNIEVDLFRATDEEEYKLDPTYLGWKKAAAGGINIHNISGNHLNIVAPPNDIILAKKMQEILNKRHSNT